MVHDVIILGSGPAGLTAAIYSQRFGFKTAIVMGRTWGGQLMQTTDVENFPSHAHIQGPDLMMKMREQVKGLGIEMIEKDFTKLDATTKPFKVTAEDQQLESKTVIVATGADTKWLGVPGEEKLRGHGVSACAPCDAFFFKGKPVAVVGGGDSAMEETHVIAKFSPDVVLIHRRDEFRAQKAMQDKVLSLPHVKLLYNSKVIDVVGDKSLEKIIVETAAISPKQGVKTLDELVASFAGKKLQGNQWELPRQGIFVAIGLVPNTQKFMGLDIDSHGYVKRYEEKMEGSDVTKYFTKTNIPGVFTAGDVHDARYKQAITAAAFGCMAAMDVERYLAENG